MKAINNGEAMEMMHRCKNEIIALRREIERLAPKAAAYDNIAMVLDLLPKRGVGMSEDLVWLLDKRIKELTPANDTKD